MSTNLVAKSETEAKVIARNRLNAQINQWAPVILEAIKPFVGKKVLTNDGLATKFKSILEPYLGFEKVCPKLEIYRCQSTYSFVLIFRTTENYSEYNCIYQEQSVYFGELDGYILTKLFNFEPLQTNFDLNKVVEIREKIRALEREKNQLESEIYHFGV